MTSLLRKVGLGLMVLMLTPAALAAGTAANTQLQNEVTVNFDNLAGVAQTAVTANVTITINLVQATPSISINSTTPADTTTDISEGQVVSVFYQVQSNANGPDTYEINFTEALTDLNGSTITEGLLPQTRTIGNLGASNVGVATALTDATCVLPGATMCDLELPNDNGDVGFSDVNGIAAGDTVAINSTIDADVTTLFCTVDSIDDANEGSPYEPGVTASSITISACAADLAGTAPTLADNDFDLAIGDDVLETAEFQVDFTMGTLTGGTAGSTTVSAIADTTTGSNPSANVDQLINVDPVTLTVTKYVRNVDTSEVGAGGSLVANGNTYYITGITAAPTQTLEYAVLVQNDGGPVQDVIITDPLVPFTTYVATSAGLIDQGTIAGCPACVVTTTGSFATVVDDTLVNAADIGGDNAGTITIYAGTGGSETGDGGAIAVGEVTVGFIQVTVD
ncbi:MAG: hypothetical protein AAF525_08035 [Pseudomonadota bacterium]